MANGVLAGDSWSDVEGLRDLGTSEDIRAAALNAHDAYGAAESSDYVARAPPGFKAITVYGQRLQKWGVMSRDPNTVNVLYNPSTGEVQVAFKGTTFDAHNSGELIEDALSIFGSENDHYGGNVVSGGFANGLERLINSIPGEGLFDALDTARAEIRATSGNDISKMLISGHSYGGALAQMFCEYTESAGSGARLADYAAPEQTTLVTFGGAHPFAKGSTFSNVPEQTFAFTNSGDPVPLAQGLAHAGFNAIPGMLTSPFPKVTQYQLYGNGDAILMGDLTPLDHLVAMGVEAITPGNSSTQGIFRSSILNMSLDNHAMDLYLANLAAAGEFDDIEEWEQSHHLKPAKQITKWKIGKGKLRVVPKYALTGFTKAALTPIMGEENAAQVSGSVDAAQKFYYKVKSHERKFRNITKPIVELLKASGQTDLAAKVKAAGHITGYLENAMHVYMSKFLREGAAALERRFVEWARYSPTMVALKMGADFTGPLLKAYHTAAMKALNSTLYAARLGYEKGAMVATNQLKRMVSPEILELAESAHDTVVALRNVVGDVAIATLKLPVGLSSKFKDVVTTMTKLSNIDLSKPADVQYAEGVYDNMKAAVSGSVESVQDALVDMVAPPPHAETPGLYKDAQQLELERGAQEYHDARPHLQALEEKFARDAKTPSARLRTVRNRWGVDRKMYAAEKRLKKMQKVGRKAFKSAKKTAASWTEEAKEAWDDVGSLNWGEELKPIRNALKPMRNALKSMKKTAGSWPEEVADALHESPLANWVEQYMPRSTNPSRAFDARWEINGFDKDLRDADEILEQMSRSTSEGWAKLNARGEAKAAETAGAAETKAVSGPDLGPRNQMALEYEAKAGAAETKAASSLEGLTTSLEGEAVPEKLSGFMQNMNNLMERAKGAAPRFRSPSSAAELAEGSGAGSGVELGAIEGDTGLFGGEFEPTELWGSKPEWVEKLANKYRGALVGEYPGFAAGDARYAGSTIETRMADIKKWSEAMKEAKEVTWPSAKLVPKQMWREEYQEAVEAVMEENISRVNAAREWLQGASGAGTEFSAEAVQEAADLMELTSGTPMVEMTEEEIRIAYEAAEGLKVAEAGEVAMVEQSEAFAAAYNDLAVTETTELLEGVEHAGELARVSMAAEKVAGKAFSARAAGMKGGATAGLMIGLIVADQLVNGRGDNDFGDTILGGEWDAAFGQDTDTLTSVTSLTGFWIPTILDAGVGVVALSTAAAVGLGFMSEATAGLIMSSVAWAGPAGMALAVGTLAVLEGISIFKKLTEKKEDPHAHDEQYYTTWANQSYTAFEMYDDIQDHRADGEWWWRPPALYQSTNGSSVFSEMNGIVHTNHWTSNDYQRWHFGGTSAGTWWGETDEHGATSEYTQAEPEGDEEPGWFPPEWRTDNGFYSQPWMMDMMYSVYSMTTGRTWDTEHPYDEQGHRVGNHETEAEGVLGGEDLDFWGWCEQYGGEFTFSSASEENGGFNLNVNGVSWRKIEQQVYVAQWQDAGMLRNGIEWDAVVANYKSEVMSVINTHGNTEFAELPPGQKESLGLVANALRQSMRSSEERGVRDSLMRFVDLIGGQGAIEGQSNQDRFQVGIQTLIEVMLGVSDLDDGVTYGEEGDPTTTWYHHGTEDFDWQETHDDPGWGYQVVTRTGFTLDDIRAEVARVLYCMNHQATLDSSGFFVGMNWDYLWSQNDADYDAAFGEGAAAGAWEPLWNDLGFGDPYRTQVLASFGQMYPNLSADELAAAFDNFDQSNMEYTEWANTFHLSELPGLVGPDGDTQQAASGMATAEAAAEMVTAEATAEGEMLGVAEGDGEPTHHFGVPLAEETGTDATWAEGSSLAMGWESETAGLPANWEELQNFDWNTYFQSLADAQGRPLEEVDPAGFRGDGGSRKRARHGAHGSDLVAKAKWNKTFHQALHNDRAAMSMMASQGKAAVRGTMLGAFIEQMY
jgi:hypothetical protein